MVKVEAIPAIRLETEQGELLSLAREDRTLRILHRLSLREGKLQRLAADIFYALRDIPEGGTLQVHPSYFDVSAPLASALRYELDSERLLYGDESVPERQEFLRNREVTQEYIRKLKLGLHREDVNAKTELLSEREQRESVLYQEVNEILQNVARELGFRRPIVLEISRTPNFNAFVLTMALEGQDFNEPSIEPLHVFVNAGFIRYFVKIFEKEGKKFTKDHLAGWLGHELKHLTQPEYDLDNPGSRGADAAQRYEYDADTGGVEAIDQAGYNPRAFIECFELLMKNKSKWEEVIGHYFSRTHPLNENRLKNLLEEFHRGDRILYSTSSEYQEFSEEGLVEAKEFVREELKEKLEAARSLDDWHTILDSIEADPRATIRDVEIALNYYKIHLDTRSALAVAVRELKTGELGLRDAALYTLSAYATGNSLKFDLLGQGSGLRGLPEMITKDLLPELSKGAAEDLEQEYDASIAYPEAVRRLVEYTMEHTLMMPPEELAFQTIDQALDPHHTRADVFTMKGITDVRAFLIETIARRILAGAKADVRYEEDDIDIKEAILKAMRETRPAASTPPETTEAFPKNIGELRRALENRISSTGIHVGSAPRVPQKYPRYQDYPIHVETFHSPVVQSEEAADAHTPLSQLTARFLRLARTEYTRALGQERARDVLGEEVADAPQAKEWLFQNSFPAFLFRLPAPEYPVTTLQELQDWTPIGDYVRLLPLHKRRFAVPRPAEDAVKYLPDWLDHRVANRVGEVVRGQFSDEMRQAKVEDVSEHLERIRMRSHHPTLSEFFRNSGDHHLTGSISDPDLQACYKEPSTLWSGKIKLVQRWMEHGLRVGDKDDSRAFLQESKGVLIEMARSKGLPDDFFFDSFRRAEARQETWGQMVASAVKKVFGSRPEPESWYPVAQKLNRVASEFFAAHFTDDVGELSSVRPNTISLTFPR